MNKLFVMTFTAAGVLASAADVHAQTYPHRPIRLIVPYAPGGTVDVIARVIAGPLEAELGQPTVVDNRGGASGIIGTDLVAKAAPDGYTMLFHTPTIVVNRSVFKNLPYDIKDFAPVTNTAKGVGYLLVVNSSVPVHSVQELIAFAKKKDNPLTYGSTGVGSTSTHLATELFAKSASIRLLPVQYKGVGPAVSALLGGEVQLMLPPTVAVQYIKAGRLRALGFTSPKRWENMPDLPTLAESGLPGFSIAAGWMGWFAPARTPVSIINRLQAAIHNVLQLPKVRDFLTAGGYEAVGDLPAEFGKFLHSEDKRYRALAREAGIEPQ